MLTLHDRKRVLRIRGLTPGLQYKYKPLAAELSSRRFVKAKRIFGKAANVLEQLRKQMESRNNDAATVISRFWFSHRHMSTKRLIKKLMDVGLLGSNVRRMGFDELVVFLRDKNVIATTKNILHRVHYQSYTVHGTADISEEDLKAAETINVRVFVASYMISFYPSHVFESMGPLERELLTASTNMITCFEQMNTQFVDANQGFSGIDSEVRSKFFTLLVGYMIIFRKWKVPDEAKLTGRIRNAIMALHRATMTLRSDEPADSNLSVELRTQTVRLYEKLRMIAGPDAVTALKAEIAVMDIGGSSPISNGNYYPGTHTNESLAHDLLLDPKFLLDYVDNETTGNIRFIFQDAFWVSVEDDLKLQPRVFVRVIRILKEINGALEDTTHMTRSQISMIVDVNLIQSYVDNNAFDWPEVIALGQQIYNLIRRHQLPVHDAQTRIKWAEIKAALEAAPANNTEANAFVNMLRWFINHLGNMRIDKANARLRLISPVVSIHGVDYEKGKFDAALEAGTLTLAKTQAYVQNAVLDAIRLGSTVSLTQLLDGEGGAYYKLLSCAMLNSVFNVELKIDEIPETLRFDSSELLSIANRFSVMVSTEAAMTMIRSSLNGFRSIFTVVEINECISAVSKKVRYCIANNFESALTEGLTEELAKTRLEAKDQRIILNQTLLCSKPGSPTYKYLDPRIKRTFTNMFKNVTLTGAEIADIKHYPVVVERLVHTHKRLRRIFDVSLQVHGERYNSIIRTVVGSI